MLADIDLVRLHDVCEKFGLVCSSEPGIIVIQHKQSLNAGSEKKEDAETSLLRVDPEAETKDEDAFNNQNIAESDSIENTSEKVDFIDMDGTTNMNSLLSSLAKERAARQQKSETPKLVETKKKKNRKSKAGKKSGGTKAKSKQDDGLDDLAFLDAQIEKVQTSHGRKIDAGGSNYKTIVNGILLRKPKPQEKKRDTRAASALNSKLKQAQQSRTAKPKKK